jgi:hypothetical protein
MQKTNLSNAFDVASGSVESELAIFKQFFQRSPLGISCKYRTNEKMASLLGLNASSLNQIIQELWKLHSEGCNMKKKSVPIWRVFMAKGWEVVLEYIFDFWFGTSTSDCLMSTIDVVSNKGHKQTCRVFFSISPSAAGLPQEYLFVFKPI